MLSVPRLSFVNVHNCRIKRGPVSLTWSQMRPRNEKSFEERFDCLNWFRKLTRYFFSWARFLRSAVLCFRNSLFLVKNTWHSFRFHHRVSFIDTFPLYDPRSGGQMAKGYILSTCTANLELVRLFFWILQISRFIPIIYRARWNPAKISRPRNVRERKSIFFIFFFSYFTSCAVYFAVVNS